MNRLSWVVVVLALADAAIALMGALFWMHANPWFAIKLELCAIIILGWAMWEGRSIIRDVWNTLRNLVKAYKNRRYNI